MKVYSWTGAEPNFGDDLNHFLWAFLMPEVVADEEDGSLLIGVGTVLSHRLPAASPRVVMGSGVGYSDVPANVTEADWRVYAVRGPRTAKLLGLPDDRAVVDPAVLLPDMPDWTSSSHGDAIFVPHWLTAPDPDWKIAAENAGLRVVDPRQEAKHVIRELAGARLVVAESMHAAIIADAFRVPWIPVIATHRALFKWNDWADSLSIAYKPRAIGPFARLQARLAPNPQFTGRGAGQGEGQSPHPKVRRSSADLAQSAVRSIPGPIRRALMARDFSSAKQQAPFMSADGDLLSRQALLRERIAQLRDDYAAGRIIPRDD